MYPVSSARRAFGTSTAKRFDMDAERKERRGRIRSRSPKGRRSPAAPTRQSPPMMCAPQLKAPPSVHCTRPTNSPPTYFQANALSSLSSLSAIVCSRLASCLASRPLPKDVRWTSPLQLRKGVAIGPGAINQPARPELFAP